MRTKLSALVSLAIALVFLWGGTPANAVVSSLTAGERAVPIPDYTRITVTGSLVCSQTDQVSFEVLVLQAKSNTLGVGIGGVNCTGSPQTYSVDVDVTHPDNGAYENGLAFVFIDATDQTDKTDLSLVTKLAITPPNNP